MNIDFETEPIGVGKDGKNVFLRDIWPSSEEVASVSVSRKSSLGLVRAYPGIVFGILSSIRGHVHLFVLVSMSGT